MDEKVIAGAIQHMNEDHAANLLDYARVLAECEWADSAEMTTLDANGFNIQVHGSDRSEDRRIEFDKPVSDGKELRMALVDLAQRADIPDGIVRIATASVPTPNAERYVKALCNHFNRKAEGSYEGNRGNVSFAFGDAELAAVDEVIELKVSAESEKMFARIKHVVDDHLIRFAKKETLMVEWQDHIPG